MPQTFVLPRQRELDDDANPLAGALLYFFQTGTTTPQAVYSDIALTTPHAHPVVADSSGRWPKIYLDSNEEANYAALITTASGVQLYREDDIDRFTVSADEIIRVLGPQTEAEAAVDITPVQLIYKPGNIRRYGAVCDGVTDDSAAFRKALDLAAYDGTTVVCDPPGDIKLNSTVYIPQRTAAGKRGFLISLYGSVLIGQGRGTGTILESGTGTRSTGGATNFGQGNETGGALHYGTVIEGARFKSCDLAVKLFNFTKGCQIRDLWMDDVDRALVAQRCFYMETINVHAIMDTVAAGEPLFDFTEVNNAMVIQGCEAGSSVGTNPTGIGYRFTGGGSGIVFQGNAAESLDKGIVFNGAIQSVDIRQNYFENITTTAIDGTVAGSKQMDIEGNWFLGCAECIDAIEWTHGRWGQSNYISGTGGIVKVNDAASLATIELAPQYFSIAEGNASAAAMASIYQLGESVKVVSSRRIYDSAVGLDATIAIDGNASKSVPAFAYTGGNGRNGTGFNVPFVSQTLNSGSSVLDTQILWSDYRMALVFDLYTEINASAKRIRGLILASGFVHRLDSESNISVTATNNSTKLRLTIAGSDHTGHTAAGFLGQIRHL